jgi:hypothetical protein
MVRCKSRCADGLFHSARKREGLDGFRQPTCGPVRGLRLHGGGATRKDPAEVVGVTETLGDCNDVHPLRDQLRDVRMPQAVECDFGHANTIGVSDQMRSYFWHPRPHIFPFEHVL